MTLSPTPFNDTCEPEDKAGWQRVQVRGTNMVTGDEVVETIWMPIGLNPREISSVPEPTSILAATFYPKDNK